MSNNSNSLPTQAGKITMSASQNAAALSFSKILIRTMNRDLETLSRGAAIPRPSIKSSAQLADSTKNIPVPPSQIKTSVPPPGLPIKTPPQPPAQPKPVQPQSQTQIPPKFTPPIPPAPIPTAPKIAPVQPAVTQAKTAFAPPPVARPAEIQSVKPLPTPRPKVSLYGPARANIVVHEKKPLAGKIILLSVICAILAALGAGAWFLYKNNYDFSFLKNWAFKFPFTQNPTPNSATPSVSTAPTQTPLFEMDNQQIIQLSDGENRNTELEEILDSLPKSTQAKIITHLIFAKNNEIPNLVSLGSALNFSSFVLSVKDEIQVDRFSAFIYYQNIGQDSSPFSGQIVPRIGFALALDDAQTETNVKTKIKELEPTLAANLKSLFKKDENIPDKAKFTSNTYKNIDIRYTNFPQSTLSIDYAVVKNMLLITTSKESMYACLDRLLD